MEQLQNLEHKIWPNCKNPLKIEYKLLNDPIAIELLTITRSHYKFLESVYKSLRRIFQTEFWR